MPIIGTRKKHLLPQRKYKTCSICHKHFTEWGNNAWPINKGTCCDHCDRTVVLPARLRMHGYK